MPAVDVYFRGLAPSMPPEWRSRYAAMDAALREPGVAGDLLREFPGHFGLTRNTCNITRLGASDKINVVPSGRCVRRGRRSRGNVRSIP